MPLIAEHTVRRTGPDGPDAGYRVAGNPAGPDLDILLWGEWTVGLTDALAVDFAKIVRAMTTAGAVHGHFRTLVDMCGKRTTCGDAVADFRRFTQAGSPSRRIAIVSTAASLPARIAPLIGPPPRVAIFHDPAAARLWLRAEPCATAA